MAGGASGRAWRGIVLAGLLVCPPAAAAPAPECAPGPARIDALESVGPRGELRLASGGRAVLGSLRWPDDPAVAAIAHAWLMAYRGPRLVLVPRGEPDRWERARVDAVIDEAELSADFAGDLIGMGLAYADAGEGDALCRPALLRVEAGARSAGRGLWQVPLPEARDGPALRAREGRFTVVEGVVRHVGERSARTYLDFVRRGEDGLTVTVSKRTWRRMREHGLTAGLEGARVRVRGFLEVRRGPTIELTAPEALERVEAGPDRGSGQASGSEQGERARRR